MGQADTITAIGMMSGTSMDGIDLALIRTDGETVIERGPSMMIPYDPAFRSRLADALGDAAGMSRRDDRPGNLAAIEAEITRRHAEAVDRFRGAFKAETAHVDLVGFHGQTVLHRPGTGLTVQLGDGQVLADQIGIPVVWDMRANDMVHGGQGAPLVPVFHQALAASAQIKGPVMFVNIGGIANVTWVAEGRDPVAFDCGPGNALIDQWVQAGAGIPYDEDGRIAAEGEIVQDIIDQQLAKPFFGLKGPKSLDRNDFTPDVVAGFELADGARTLAALTAQAIHQSGNLVPAPPRTWVLCGGGRKNTNIVSDLRALADSDSQDVLMAEDAGFNGDTMEAEAWAYLAVRSARGLPLTFPGTTGCKQPVTGGVLSRPRLSAAVSAAQP